MLKEEAKQQVVDIIDDIETEEQEEEGQKGITLVILYLFLLACAFAGGYFLGGGTIF